MKWGTRITRIVRNGPVSDSEQSAQVREIRVPKDIEPYPPRSRTLAALRVALEAGVLLVEEQIHQPRRAVALLANDHLGLALERIAVLVRRTVVELLAVQEHDQVGVLLDGARLAEVRQLRALVVARALLGCAREL